MPATISRAAYAAMFGPTLGDRVRLADTSLFIQVERDLTTYGEEVVSGAGKVARDGMGQGQTCWAEGAPDTVITNVLILDHSGIVKADVSIRDGIIGTIGKAGNPAIQPDVNIPIGPGTAIIAGEGKILTAGGIDTQVIFTGARQMEEALLAGITTMFGGGIGPGPSAATPGAWHIGKLIDAADAFPLNLGFACKGSSATPEALVEQLIGGACALAIDPAWGATPAAIDCCLSVADEHDVQVSLQADASNEADSIEGTIIAFKGRTLLGIVGGQPDDLRFAGLNNVLPASAAFGGHAAQAVLHDIGGLSIVSSGSRAQAGAIVRWAWQIADAMKQRRGALPGDGSQADNSRAKRYIAKYTINPAIAHGVADHIGSVEMGKLADVVLWSPAFFGVRPDLVLKGGIVAATAAPTASDDEARLTFGACGGARIGACLTFVSQAALDKNLGQRLRTQRRLVAVRKTRGDVDKTSMVFNDAMPAVRVDADGTIEIDGARPPSESTGPLPMAQRYHLF